MIGNFHRDTGNLEEAERIYSQVLSGLERIADPYRFLAQYNIGLLRMKQERKEEAKVLLTDARDGLLSVFGPENQYTKDAERELTSLAGSSV